MSRPLALSVVGPHRVSSTLVAAASGHLGENWTTKGRWAGKRRKGRVAVPPPCLPRTRTTTKAAAVTACWVGCSTRCVCVEDGEWRVCGLRNRSCLPARRATSAQECPPKRSKCLFTRCGSRERAARPICRPARQAGRQVGVCGVYCVLAAVCVCECSEGTQNAITNLVRNSLPTNAAAALPLPLYSDNSSFFLCRIPKGRAFPSLSEGRYARPYHVCTLPCAR